MITIRGLFPSEDLSVSVRETPFVIGGGPGTETELDITVPYVDPTATDPNFRIVAGGTRNIFTAFENLTPEVASIDEAGNVARIVDGEFRCYVKGTYGKRLFTRPLVRVTPGVRVYDRTAAVPSAGSLLKHLTDTQIALLSEVTPGSTNQRSRGTNGSGDTNTSNMLLRDDITGWTAVPFAQFNAAVQSTLLAIGPHHYLYVMGKGHGNVASTGQRNVGSDTQVRYSASVLSGYHFRFLPANWLAYFPTRGMSSYVPIWTNKWWVHDSNPVEYRWIQPARDIEYNPERVLAEEPEIGAIAAPFCTTTLSNQGVPIIGVGGDSGSLMFLVINGEIVPYSSISFYGGWGDCYAYYQSQISQAMKDTAQEMNDLDYATYAPLTVDLSAFNTYS